MNHASLAAFLERDRAALAKGPVAIIVVEDPVEVESTLNHHIGLGFRTLITFMPDGLELPATLADQVHRIPYATRGPEALPGLINPLIAAAPAGTWFYYGFNAEYLFYPFSETRNLRELLAFHTEERRDAMLCYAIDLYAPDLGTHPSGVDRDGAMLDR